MSKKFCYKNIFKVNEKEILLELIKYLCCRHIETSQHSKSIDWFLYEGNNGT